MGGWMTTGKDWGAVLCGIVLIALREQSQFAVLGLVHEYFVDDLDQGVERTLSWEIC